MKNRLYGYICVLVLLEIIQPPISYAKVVNDAHSFRTKRSISVDDTPQPKGNTKDLRKVSSKIEEEDNNDFANGNTCLEEKHKISKRSANSANAGKPIGYDNAVAISHRDTQRSNDESAYAEEADEEVARQERDKDEETSNLIRLARDVNADSDKYTEQDERASLYDDYEAKDVAKRGVLGSPGDYEEAEDDSPPGIEDAAAVQGRESTIDEVDKSEVQNDARVKRDRAKAEAPDTFESISDNSAGSAQPKIAPEGSYLRQVPPVGSLKSFNEASASNDASKIKESGLNEAISKAKTAEPADVITSSRENEGSAKYEKRVEEEIQRKIDSIKEEIQRDIEAQQRVRDVERNNARFDMLQKQEDAYEDRSSEPIEKRQTAAKRSVREIADVQARSRRNGKKQKPAKKQQQQQRKKAQPRTRGKKIGKSDIPKKSKNLKRRSAGNHDESSGQTSSKGLSKKKRERVRQTFLVSDEQAKKRRSTSYALPTGAKRENTLFMDRDSNARLCADDKMLLPLSVASEDENNGGEQNPAAAARSNSLAPLTGSSQELNPRLAREYKEAFGGLQSESGNALARFKRIKRVLGDPETEKI